MSRYIDADALTEMLHKKAKTDYEMGIYNHAVLTESFIRLVENQPTADVVEVVRCRDCMHNRDNGGDCDRTIILNEDDSTEYRCAGLEYCSYGERREGCL